MNGIRIDPDSIHIDDDAWEFVEADEDYITHRADIGHSYVYRKQPRGADLLIHHNLETFKDSETYKTRFNDKSAIGQKVASIPLNVLFDPKHQLSQKIQEGDKDHLKWFLNRDEARPWRNFRGKV